MRFFKHFSDNHRGQSMQYIRQKLGHKGVSCYYVLMEICAEKIEPESDFVFVFNRRYFENVLGIKRKCSENILRTFEEAGVLKAFCSENEIKIEVPIFANLLDRDMKKPRLKRAQPALNPRLDIDIDKDKDIRGATARADDPPLLKEIKKVVEYWNQHSGPLPKVKEVTKKRISAFKKLTVKIRPAEDWIRAIENLASSPFHRGENDRKWVADFDFFLREENLTRCLEGAISGRVAEKQAVKISWGD